MIFDVIIMAICTFVVLKKTNNIWISASVFAGIYTIIKLFGNNPFVVLLLFFAGMFVYGLIIFKLLIKFREDDNTTAFVAVFCLAQIIKALVVGWG